MRITATVFAAIAFIGATLAPALAQAPPPVPPPWNPGGGTVDPKDPNLWHNPKDGPSDYVWNPKICRWVYKGNGKDALGNHKDGDVATQGAPQGVPPGSGKMTGPGTAKDGSGNTYTYDDDTTDAKGVKTPGKGWVDDKSGKSLCIPPKAAAVNPGPAPQTVPGQGVAPEHTSVIPPPSTTAIAVSAPSAPGYPGTPFYNTPFGGPGAPFYNTPMRGPGTGVVYNGWYVALSGGPSFVPTVMATEFFNDGKSRFPWGSSTGPYFGADVGYQNGNWRVEGQYTWSVNPAAATMPLPPNVKIGGETETHGFFANGIYTPPFVLGIPVTPHIGVGVGALDVSTTIKVNGTKVFDSDNWAPGAQAIGGLRYQISPQWSIDLDYRYQTTLGDVEYKSLANGNNPRNKVDSPYHAHYVLARIAYLFAPESPAPAPAAPPPPAPRSALPQAHQVASLAPVEAEAGAAHRFTLRYDEADAVLTPSSVRALHEALDAIEAGQDVRIAIAGCETDGAFTDGSPCARHALRLRHLLARYGVANPGYLLAGG